MKEKNPEKINTAKSSVPTEWEVAAQEELKGANPWEKLSHNVRELPILPIYNKTEKNQPEPLLKADKTDILGARTWYNCPHVKVSGEKKSNEEALDHLKNGADGIWFEIQKKTDFRILLKGIDIRYCSINFLAKENARELSNQYAQYLKSQKFIESIIAGSFIGNFNSKELSENDFYHEGLQVDYHSDPVKELTQAFEIFSSEKPKKIAFSITLDNDFFMSLSKLRAARLVLRNISSETSLFIHARAPEWIEKKYQPHENMLSGTTTALSAILGGCDALTVEPSANDHALTSRIARNISNILREESHLSKVADPVAGSYFIETLTRQIADGVIQSLTFKKKP